MNERNWIHDIQWQDVDQPVESEGDSEVYTLYLQDFLKMPEVNYAELATLDPNIRALLN